MNVDFPPLAAPPKAPRARRTLLAASSPHVLELDQTLAIVGQATGLAPAEVLNRSLCGLPIGTAQAHPLADRLPPVPSAKDQAEILRDRHGYMLRG